MDDRFHECLAKVLQAETGYNQPIGGPYVRFKPTKKHPVDPRQCGKPDGRAFDDDPDDTGGRPCMGLLQREFNPYLKSKGEDARDVWEIDDEAVEDIYLHQYWDVMRCDKLPPGIDFATFDSGVNCGVGMGARFLQQAAGVTVDGHIGFQTLEAVNAADPSKLIYGIIEARELYHRHCKTFWKHGDGWLERDRATEHEALIMIGRRADAPAAVDYAAVSQDSRRATPPAPPASVAETSTGQSAIASGSTGTGLTLTSGIDLAMKVDQIGFAKAILNNPINIGLIVAGLVLVALARRDWIDRGFKLIRGV
jgi:lysozyme family protein